MDALNEKRYEECVAVSILTARVLKGSADLAKVLERLARYPDLMPDRISDTEPLRLAFDPAKVEQIADELWNNVSVDWRRKRPKGVGAVRPGDRFEHCGISHLFYDLGMTPALIRFLREEAVHCHADIGCVEPSWPGERGRAGTWEATYPPSTPPEVFDMVGGGGLYTIEIKDRLIQLSWATLFGPPYVRMFGREHLLSAPAAIVEEIAPDMIYIQLTPKVEDVTKDLNAYFALRRRVKEHIGADAFFDPAKGKGPYRVPKFELEPWPQPRPLGSIGGAPIVGLISGHPIVERGGRREILSEINFGPHMFLIAGAILKKGMKPRLGTIGGQQIVAVDETGHPVVQQADGTSIVRSDIQVGWHRPEGRK